MKLLFVISTLNTGGAQRALSNIVCNLQEQYEIDILLNDNSEIVYPYKGHIITLGLAEQVDKLKLSYQIKVFFKRMDKLKKLKKVGNYDFCISFLDSANIINILTGNKYCKTIVSVRAHLTKMVETSWKYKYIVSPMVKLFYNRGDKVVAVAEGTAYDLQVNYGIRTDKLVTIYNGVDINKIQQQGASNESSQVYTICTMGRLEEQKGQWHLIHAFSKFHKEYPESRLQILGEGDLKDKFEKLITELQLNDCVELLGFVKKPYEIISQANLFVLPSIYEGFPNALVEAMACGIPVIATDCDSGAREILAPNTDFRRRSDVNKNREPEFGEYGLLVPCGEPRFSYKGDSSEEVLRKAIKILYLDKKRSQNYSKKSYERAEQLSIENAALEWENLFKHFM